ncbi:MAG TPA: DUF4443 domain-containing protein [Methylomirabilota bacterium]|nr:DUF4443 domain-containing protein [Methylomirabilota bacterium]
MKKDGLLARLQALAQLSSAGPSPSFAYPQVACALLHIGDDTSVGRTQLAKTLGLGEGTTRTIIRHLTLARLVKSSKQGCTLTPSGLLLYKRLRSKLSKTTDVNAGQLSLDNANTAVLVKKSAHSVKQGIEERDAAVRSGATGACTILMKHGRLVMPQGSGEWKRDLDDPLARELVSLFHPQNDDVIIIASATEKSVADYAAIAAGLLLLD